MSDLTLTRVISDSARSSTGALIATLPFAFLYCLVAGLGGAVVQTQAGGGWAGFAALVAILIAGALWSAALYGRLMPDSKRELMRGTRVLSIANALVYMLYGLLGFILMLALFLITLMLAVGSGYDMSADQTESFETSLNLLRASGAIWIWYALIAATVGVLGWFAVRLLVFGAASFDAGAVRIFQTWGWTKGRVAAFLVPVSVLVVGPFMVVGAAQLPLAAALGEPMGWAPWAVGYGVADIAEVAFANIAIFWALSAAMAAIPIALGHALAVQVYRAVRPKL
jgi:hypothetical protein